MNKENMEYTHNGVLFRHNEEQTYVVCTKMTGTIDHHDR
jgi:hypothetical protein